METIRLSPFWKNVTGVFSLNDRIDFKSVLESFLKTEVPIPPSRKWTHAGMVRGRNLDVCWRVLDSQYLDVPKRRRRIFLAADFREFRAREVLFDTEGMQSIFNLATKTGCSPQRTIESFIMRQGGTYGSSLFKKGECEATIKKEIKKGLSRLWQIN